MGTKEKDKHDKVVEAAGGGGSEPFNLDGILCELGSFGRYQLLLLLLLAFRDSFLNMCNYNYIFTAVDVPFSCVSSECERAECASNVTWSSNAAALCSRGAPPNRSLPHATAPPNRTAAPDQPHTAACTKRIYQDYNSLVAEFDLGCEPWKRTLVGTVHNLGLVFSFILFGIISDRYGRKVVIVGSPVAVAVAGLTKSFARSYWLLVALEFTEAALGYGNASLVLSLESVPQSRRVSFSCCADVLSSVGGALLGLIAWRVPHWRWLVRAIYAPLLAVLLYCWLVDEGVRWLLARGRTQDAAKVLNKVARTNGVTLSARAAHMLSAIAAPPAPAPAAAAALGVLRSRVMAWRVGLMAACFFCCLLLYNGAVVMSASAAVSSDRYLNFSALMLAGVPTRLITAVTLSRYGRKAPIHIAYVLCAVFFVCSAFVPVGGAWRWAGGALYVLGMMCSSYGTFALCVVALEVFPTTHRNSLTNLAYTLGRLGSVLAPSLPLLDTVSLPLPSLVFGGVSLSLAVLALLLPDGSRRALPDDVTAAEHVADVPPSDGPPPPALGKPAAQGV